MMKLASGIYAILDTDRLGWTDASMISSHFSELDQYATAAAEGGAIAVQLRCKTLPLGDPVRLQAVLRLTDLGLPVPLLVNDDAELLQHLKAPANVGLHLGQNDADPASWRRRLGDRLAIGLSTHNLAQVVAAQGKSLNYLGFGPIRSTVSKADADAVTGFSGLRAAVHASDLPVVAIGGLELSDIAAISQTGCHAAAVIGAWLGPSGRPYSPAQSAAAMRELVAAWRS